MFRNIARINISYVPDNLMVAREVFAIGLLGIFINFAGKYALSAYCLEPAS
jgi:hypothetical protein